MSTHGLVLEVIEHEFVRRWLRCGVAWLPYTTSLPEGKKLTFTLKESIASFI